MMIDTTTEISQPKSAIRGNPSFVWRAGQERRLAMLNNAVPLSGKTVLVDGCGLGAYVRGIRRFTTNVYGLDIEVDRVIEGAHHGTANLMAAVCEQLPYADNTFDIVYSHEVLEHVQDDRQACREMSRVLRPGGYAALFVPNRLYPFETHGVYLRGRYHFGNKPLVNWLPDYWRNRLAPHVRAYTTGQLIGLFDGTPMRLERITQIYPGFDNIVARFGAAGKALRAFMQGLEASPLRAFGLSHFLVMRKAE